MSAEAHGQICKTDPCRHCQEAFRRAKEALAHIQRAQTELNAACERLSPLVGGIPEWKKAGDLADRTKALWHRVAQKAQAYTLDDISKVREDT
jgi:hypothetical protein